MLARAKAVIFKVFVIRLCFLGLCLQGLRFRGLRFQGLRFRELENADLENADLTNKDLENTASACERNEFKSLSSSFLFLFEVCVFETPAASSEFPSYLSYGTF